jgi:hypothetical protein
VKSLSGRTVSRFNLCCGQAAVSMLTGS